MINQAYISAKFNEVVDPHLDREKILRALYEVYAGTNRQYHTMVHIQSMLLFLDKRMGYIQDWKSVGLATFFHDAVYDTLRNDNEDKSVEFMQQFGITNTQAEKLILATKKHVLDMSVPDSGIFLDADLSILGSSGNLYEMYYRHIRQEYLHVPWDEYVEGRIQILCKFLQREHIYFTPDMRQEFELRARQNLTNEIGILVNKQDEKRKISRSSGDDSLPYHQPLVGGSWGEFDEPPVQDVRMVGGSWGEFNESPDDHDGGFLFRGDS